jgi:lysosomal acid lipase/cholesteryl ester hydrolase
MFYGLSSDKQTRYADKINFFVALAPLTKIDNMRSKFITFFSNFQGIIEWTTNLFGAYEAFGEAAHVMTKFQCGFIPELCRLGISFTQSDDTQFDDLDRLNIYEGHFPAGSSMRSLDHYGQMFKSHNFEMFDFGEKRNQERYG